MPVADQVVAALAWQEAVALIAEYCAVLAERAVPEWRSVLDVVLEQPMGTKFVTLALESTDTRVKAGKGVSAGLNDAASDP